MKSIPILILTVIIATSAAAGIIIAGTQGFGPLAYLSYNVIVPKENETISIIPAYLDLGNLTPGKAGSVSAVANITIKSNGTYTISLLHTEKLEKVFSNFTIIIEISNKKVKLNLENEKAKLNLTAGTYEVKITVFYKVSMHPKGDLHVKKEPILIIHPASTNDNNEESED
jgi:2,5-dioxopentanoate dehydrogenase